MLTPKLVRCTPGFGDLTSASWIWAPSLMLQLPFVLSGDIGFRTIYTSLSGKTAVIANCQVRVSSRMTFYVNSLLQSTSVGTFYIPLLPFSNLFAIIANNPVFTPTPAGLIAECQIVFSDGTIDTLVTGADGTWQAAQLIGNDHNTFYQPQFYENSTWVPAGLIGPYNFPFFPPTTMQPTPPIFDFSSASWIWTNEGTSLPGEAWAFRYTFQPQSSQQPLFATVVITCDNRYTFWLNGCAALRHATTAGSNLFAFAGYNDDVVPGTAGLLVSVQIQLTSGTVWSTVNFTSNSTWKTLNSQAPPLGFQLPTFNDSLWSPATAYANYGGDP
ncbi:hypothetical protein B0H10DRAFT_1965706 [Mycena sp. CBHHK59/15]|nr:hypothetical protein B0H10DRAFT_1965706 [Mycena sp. CBHHK59/15]